MLGSNILTPYIYNIPRIFATVIKSANFFLIFYVEREDCIVCHAEFIATRIRIVPMSFPHKIRVIPPQDSCHFHAMLLSFPRSDAGISFDRDCRVKFLHVTEPDLKKLNSVGCMRLKHLPLLNHQPLLI